MNVTLVPALQEFIQQKVRQGVYSSPDEVIAASLAMMQTSEDEQWKTQAREKIEQGLLSARNGRLHDPESAAAWMAERKAEWKNLHQTQ